MTIMLKKIFSIIGLIIAVLVGLIGLLLLIIGIVETIPSMWICGIVFTALSVLGSIYCGKRVPKVKQHANVKHYVLQKNTISSSKLDASKCIVCNKRIKGTIHPKIFGRSFCRNCTVTLYTNGGISHWGVKKIDDYSLSQLNNSPSVIEPILNTILLDKNITSTEKLQQLIQLAMKITNPILVNENTTPSEKLQQLIIKNPTISLQEGEECYYQYEATAYHEKNVVTGHKSDWSGESFRVASGVYVRTGSSESQVIRENVGEYFNGTLYITNFRMVLLTPKYGFDIAFPKINQIIEHSDGFQIYSGAKCYSVLTIDIHTFIAIVKLLESINQDTALSNPKAYKTNNKANSTESNMDDLRELKKLFDEGIITEEEFNAKKKQILGI